MRMERLSLSQYPFDKEVIFIYNYINKQEYPENFDLKTKRALRKRCETFEVVDGTLFYVGRDQKKKKRVVTDVGEQREKLRLLHEGPGGGHFGSDRTRDKVHKWFYWRGINDDVINYVKHCESCQKAERTSKRAGQLHPIPVTAVWDQVDVDVIGPLPETKRGHKYIVTLSDYFSKWVEAEALVDKCATTIAHFLFTTMTRLMYMSHAVVPYAIQFLFERYTGCPSEQATRICWES